MKHLFIYLAPAYFAFYLKYLVFKDKQLNLFAFLKLAFTIVFVFVCSFLPFLYEIYKDYQNNEIIKGSSDLTDNKSTKKLNLQILIQILSRLFPFKRGLLHSYWAPNFWAIYSFIDKISLKIFKNYLGELGDAKNNSSQGLVQEVKFDVLPSIEIFHVLIIIFVLLILLILSILFIYRYKEKLQDRNNDFLKFLLISSLIFFNYGFHVHEKAFLTISIISTIFYFYKFYTEEGDSSKLNFNYDITNLLFVLTSVVGILSQAPLILNVTDYIIKLFLILLSIAITLMTISITNNTYNKETKGYYILKFLIFGVIVLDFIYVIQSNFNLSEVEIAGVNDNNILLMINYYNKAIRFLYIYKFLPIMLISVVNAFLTQVVFALALFT